MSIHEQAWWSPKIWIFFGLKAAVVMAQAAQPSPEPAAAAPLSMAQKTEVLSPSTAKKVLTVDELIQSGKLSPAVPYQPPPVAQPAPGPAPARLDDRVNTGVPRNIPPWVMKPTAPPLTLQGIFLSSHSAKAVIQTEGLRKMYVEGDSLPGGWRIRAIDTSGVGIERCDQRKCASKFLSLAD
jgi:hypothetical protein